MLQEERFDYILKKIDKEGRVKVSDLVEGLQVSESTIRRDLTELNNKQLLTKVFGGAVKKDLANYIVEDCKSYDKRKLRQSDKRKIAEYAASLVNDNDLVFLDAGTTVELMSSFLTSKKTKYVTNSWVLFQDLSRKGFDILLLGGKLKIDTLAIVGELSMVNLDKFNFTKAFIGTNGIKASSGYTTPDIREARLKSKAISQSKESFILSDDSKIGKISFSKFANISDVNLITVSKKRREIMEIEKLTSVINLE